MNAHLLIVDDDERIRSLLKQFLLRNGFLVSAARDATHARKILSGLDFDMIVLDVMQAIQMILSLGHERTFILTPLLGGLDPEFAWRGLKLFETEVWPHVKQLAAPRYFSL